MKPVELAYVGFASPDYQRWREIGPAVFGFEVAPDGTDGAIRLRLDQRDFRLAIHSGSQDKVRYLGWLLSDSTAIDTAVVELRRAGVSVTEEDAATCRARAMHRVVSFSDPFGLPHELCCGPVGGRPFTPGRAVGGFITGDGGAGHCALNVPELQAADDFFSKVMGFVPSDIIDDFTEIRFFHCNPRHHSLGLAHIPKKSAGVHHFMVEVKTEDEVGIAYDLCRQYDIPIATTIGRHPNDRMFSFYCKVPGGFELEYGCGGVRIENDATWKPVRYDRISIWGHKDAMLPTLLKKVVKTMRRHGIGEL
jgi:extradiol dioxygenase